MLFIDWQVYKLVNNITNSLCCVPFNKIIIHVIIAIILAYSVNKMMEKYKDEYSVIKPATSSDSASARSNGTLLDSPSIAIIIKFKIKRHKTRIEYKPNKTRIDRIQANCIISFRS